MTHRLAWLIRALFYAAVLALIILYILMLPGEAQDQGPTRPTAPVAPILTIEPTTSPAPTGTPAWWSQPTLSVSCVLGALTWDCTAMVHLNGSTMLHALAVDCEHLISWQQIRIADAWGVELSYRAPPPCSGEMSQIRLLAAVGEDTVELARHTVTARCNLLPFVVDYSH